MNTDNIKTVFENYIKADKTQYAILLNGAWGSGKTFFWKYSLEPIAKDNKIKTIYLSLNGIGKIEHLEHLLFIKLFPFISNQENSKLKTLVIVATNAINHLGKIFAKASLTDMFIQSKLDKAAMFSANYFSNAILINKGNLQFETKALPRAAQFSSLKDAVVVNANNDALPDIFIGGNFYDDNIEMGRYDADYGTVLINKGNGNFNCETLNGIQIKGQIRHIKPILIGKQQAYIVARNSDSAMVIKFINQH